MGALLTISVWSNFFIIGQTFLIMFKLFYFTPLFYGKKKVYSTVTDLARFLG